MLFQKVHSSITHLHGKNMSKRTIKAGKLTPRQKLEIEHRQYNKEMRSIHCHHLQKTFEQYIAYKYNHGQVVPRVLPKEPEIYRKPEQNIPSRNSRSFCPTVTTSRTYTGDVVQGVATMHKSNAVPIINQQQAEDCASMRR